MIRMTLAALLALGFSACGSGDPRSVAPPTAPTPPQPSPAPGPSSGITLSGVIFESTAQGTHPIPGSRVYYVTDDASGLVTSDASGRYSVPSVPDGGRVRITAFPGPGFFSLFQRSATTAVIHGDTVVDIELVAEGARGVTYGSPTLSGVVYHMTPDGPRPWAGTPVVYKSFEGLWYDVYQRSDAQGRYDFGRLPLGLGRLGAGNCNDQMMFTPVEIRGDTVADVDITWLLTNCPGIPF